jgi:hypothetical protein
MANNRSSGFFSYYRAHSIYCWAIDKKVFDTWVVCRKYKVNSFILTWQMVCVSVDLLLNKLTNRFLSSEKLLPKNTIELTGQVTSVVHRVVQTNLLDELLGEDWRWSLRMANLLYGKKQGHSKGKWVRSNVEDLSAYRWNAIDRGRKRLIREHYRLF